MASSLAQGIQAILYACTKHHGDLSITFEDFISFIRKFTLTQHTQGFIQKLMEDPYRFTTAALRELASKGEVQLSPPSGEEISTITYSAFFGDDLNRRYTHLKSQGGGLLPSESTLPYAIPQEMVLGIDITTNIMEIMKNAVENPYQVLRLHFPGSTHDILATTQVVKDRLYYVSLLLIRRFLRQEGVTEIVESKLSFVFHNNQGKVHDLIELIHLRADDFIQATTHPDDFHFQFCLQLSSLIISQFAERTDKTPQQHAYCQAAYLLNYYLICF